MRNAVPVLFLVACGGAIEPLDRGSESAPAPTPTPTPSPAPAEPEWNVTTGNATCDAHLEKTCRKEALECLSNEKCAALVACYRRCHDYSPGYCAGDCERAISPDWARVNPYVSCASTEPACND